MCINDVPFPDGCVADIRKAIASGEQLYFKYSDETLLFMQPHPDKKQIRDNDGLKSFKVIVNGKETIISHTLANLWKLHCGTTSCTPIIPAPSGHH